MILALRLENYGGGWSLYEPEQQESIESIAEEVRELRKLAKKQDDRAEKRELTAHLRRVKRRGRTESLLRVGPQRPMPNGPGPDALGLFQLPRTRLCLSQQDRPALRLGGSVLRTVPADWIRLRSGPRALAPIRSNGLSVGILARLIDCFPKASPPPAAREFDCGYHSVP